MASEETDIKLFTRLGQLPDDVIALIISYVLNVNYNHCWVSVPQKGSG